MKVVRNSGQLKDSIVKHHLPFFTEHLSLFVVVFSLPLANRILKLLTEMKLVLSSCAVDHHNFLFTHFGCVG